MEKVTFVLCLKTLPTFLKVLNVFIGSRENDWLYVAAVVKYVLCHLLGGYRTRSRNVVHT